MQFIRALILPRRPAARANIELKQIGEAHRQGHRRRGARLCWTGDLMQHFPVDIFQTGSGTSSNMNANEVIATPGRRAPGAANRSIPNDHVNAGQSSNDIIPTALHVSAALALHEQLLPALTHAGAGHCERKSRSVHHHVKTGRTHLMDAMPVRMSQVLDGWARSSRPTSAACKALLPSRCDRLAQGGTAVGTGVNAHPEFARASPERAEHADPGERFQPGADLLRALIGPGHGRGAVRRS